MSLELELEACTFEDATHFKVRERVFGFQEYQKVSEGFEPRPSMVQLRTGLDSWSGAFSKSDFELVGIIPMRVKKVVPTVHELILKTDLHDNTRASIFVEFPKKHVGETWYLSNLKPLTFEEPK
jgi:hypothetical protein